MKQAGITIQIEVDPTVRQWIISHNNNLPVVKFKNGDILYQMIHDWLQKANRKCRRIIPPDKCLTVYIPTSPYKNVYKTHHLSVSRQKLINSYLYQSFKAEFHKHVINKIEEGYQQREAILDYIDFYHLDETIFQFEMLKKSWDRSDEKYFYYQNAKKYTNCRSIMKPIAIDIAFVFTNISTIICPALINN